MTRLVTITKYGPKSHEPRSLADQLQASVDYNAESERQRKAMQAKREAGPLPTDEQLRIVNEDLCALVGKTRWVNQ